jgi:hypothetical protein
MIGGKKNVKERIPQAGPDNQTALAQPLGSTMIII